MSDVSPKHQLMIARQQLDRLSIFIASLADFFHGTSPAIDDEFQQIKKLLSGKPDYDKAAELSIGLNAKLKNESKFLQQKNADSLSQIHQSLRKLTDLEAIDDTVKLEIKQFIKSLSPSDDEQISPISIFEKALGLFKKALSQNVVMSKHKDEIAEKLLQEKITQELKQLIAPYYKKDSTDITLKELHQKLNEGLANKDLLKCCLTMIRFVMKDVLNQAVSATRLINDIHRSLVKINHGISSTITKSKNRIQKREKQKRVMKAQIAAMETVLSDSTDVGDLKKQATQYLVQLQNSLDMSEQEERAEQEKVILLLQSMKKRLEELESQAEGYKKKLLQQRIDTLTDGLTKLPNRMAWEEKLQFTWEKLKRQKTAAHLAILDIDHFKQINDKYGHSVGDKTLQIIANHTRKLLHKEDFLARWGGEEFAALLFDENDEQAFSKLESLREKIAKLPFMFKGNRVSVTLSIGLTSLQNHQTIDEAFEAADKFLYEAKNNGRNQTCK